MELQFPLVGPIQKGLLFLQPTPQPQDHSIIDHLKTSLSSEEFEEKYEEFEDKLWRNTSIHFMIFFFLKHK